MKYYRYPKELRYASAKGEKVLRANGMDARKIRRYKTKCALEKVSIGVFALCLIAAMAFCIVVQIGVTGGTSEGAAVFYGVVYVVGALVLSLLFSGVVLGLCNKLIRTVFRDVAEEADQIATKLHSASAQKILLEYYGFGGEYLITKCLYCTREEFVGKDVCLYFREDKLCMIYDLVTRGKSAFSKDVGCLEAELGRCEIGRAEGEKWLRYGANATMVAEGNERIVLGYKALPFIRAKARPDLSAEGNP